MTDKAIVGEKFKMRNEVTIYQTEHAQFEARIATEFAQHYGMIAAIQDGEDSAGRQKLRLLTPSEVAERSIDTARLLVEGFRKQGWMLQVPDLAEVNKDTKPD